MNISIYNHQTIKILYYEKEISFKYKRSYIYIYIYILFNIKNLSNQIVTSWTQDNWLRKPLYPQIP